ncbi:MAG: sugar porter family MFS transporter [Thermotogae bacterium]|jgi:MFS family permease|nr:sugar porter family MFS transporter [Thermotogota bacterium]MCL5032586.1 sugar porter family MFS transporter [Thermotogota bacterium]
MKDDNSKKLEEHWTHTDTLAFLSFALGMLLENYIFSLAAIATGWVEMPKFLQSLLLSWAPLWLIIGIAFAGPLSDHLGRKNTFYLTMFLYAIGAIGLIFSYSYALILIFLAIMLFAAGGEMNTIMVASHEMMPNKHRSKAMFMELNFINVGGLLLAIVSLSSAYSSVAFQRGMIAAAFLVVLGILFFTRTKLPESIRWLESKGKGEKAKEEIKKHYSEDEYKARQQIIKSSITDNHANSVSMFVKLFATIATAFAGAAGFGLLTYVLGPSYFKASTAWIILVTMAAEFGIGFVGLGADKWSRKNLLMIGYVGTFVMTLIAYLTVGVWSKELLFFFVLLIILNAFNGIGYLTEDTLKGEVWPTKVRGTYTAIVRFVSIGLYIVTIYLTQNLNLSQYMLFNLFVWAIGLAGAVVWFIWGNETGKKTILEVASGESK